MGKKRYKVKSTGEIAIPCGQDLTIERGKSLGMTDQYEIANEYGELTGKIEEFSPEELELIQQ